MFNFFLQNNDIFKAIDEEDEKKLMVKRKYPYFLEFVYYIYE
jgi:hypothetical protein